MKLKLASNNLVRGLLTGQAPDDQSGQTLVEYALILSFISVAVVGSLEAFGGGVNGLYGVIQDALDALGAGGSS